MLKVFGNQEQMKEDFCWRLGRRFFYIKLADTIARYKNRNLKPRNRIGRLKNRNSKRTDTIGRYKNRNLSTRNRIGRLKNRNSKRTDTIGRYKNRSLTSTDCIVRYNRKIESAWENRSIGPFAHLCLQVLAPPTYPLPVLTKIFWFLFSLQLSLTFFNYRTVLPVPIWKFWICCLFQSLIFFIYKHLPLVPLFTVTYRHLKKKKAFKIARCRSSISYRMLSFIA